ncbi:thiamine-phosphate kinase [Rhodococcus sp. BP-316]|uniref:thiamine-phosphate kinase n=1 Tax=Rhodococcus sp. BP-316 TaxID=2739445 RepID=UPI0027E086C3|nr:thiamine-phosphate kinase [Rhodococcus sp. BP-316]
MSQADDPATGTVGDLGEFALIGRATAGRVHPPSVAIGPGDDAAVIAAPDSRVVVTTDMLVEGRHFRLDWSSHHDVGRKAIAQNAADIAAMGARCTGFLVSMSCPSTTAVSDVDALTAGLWVEATRVGASIVGGDVTGGDRLVLSITALGDLEGRPPVLRSGARPGDALALSGPTGRSAAGWALYEAGSTTHPDLLAAHRVPTPDPADGPAAARAGASSMCDVSDGVIGDAGHLAAMSAVRLDISSADMEIPEDVVHAGTELGVDPLHWALGGGEDHVLLATFASDDVPTGWRRIGSVSAGTGVTVDGVRWEGPAAWTSF